MLPSDREGMPLAVNEAIVAGVPVIGTDVPGTRELVHGVGLLVPATPEGLAVGLDLVVPDPTCLHVWRMPVAVAARSACGLRSSTASRTSTPWPAPIDRTLPQRWVVPNSPNGSMTAVKRSR